MKVYQLQTARDRYSNFAVARAEDRFLYDHFDGKSMVAKWKPIEVLPADEDEEAAEFGDYSLLGIIPVFSRRGVESLGELLRRHGELLPLTYSGTTYYAYNVKVVRDALDEQNSRIRRFSTGAVMSVESYAFLPDRIRDVAVFKIPQLPRAFVFVTQEFVATVEAVALTGFHFRPVWEDKVMSA